MVAPWHFQELAKETLGGSCVSAARDPNTQDVAVLFHRPLGMAALPEDRAKDLILVPDIAQPARPAAQDSYKGVTEFATPTI